jgi:hypothetical protein
LSSQSDTDTELGKEDTRSGRSEKWQELFIAEDNVMKEEEHPKQMSLLSREDKSKVKATGGVRGTSSSSVPAKMRCLFSNKIAWSLSDPERLVAETEHKSLTERNSLTDVENRSAKQTCS